MKSGGYIEYVLANTDQIASDLSVACRFTTADHGRVCAIYIDGVKIADYTVPNTFAGAVNGFYYYEFPIPDSLMKGSDGKVKTSFTFRIVASGTTPTPGLYYLRLLKEYSKQYATTYRFNAQDWATTGDAARVAQSRISYSTQDNTITVKATCVSTSAPTNTPSTPTTTTSSSVHRASRRPTEAHTCGGSTAPTTARA